MNDQIRTVVNEGKTYKVYPNGNVVVVVVRKSPKPLQSKQYTRYLDSRGQLARLIRDIAAGRKVAK